jgi:hypothetical protein
MDYQGILTTTAQSLEGYVVDGIHNGSALPARFLTRTVEWDEGQYMQQPIQTEENDNGGDFVGMPEFNVSAQNTDQNMKWLAKGKRQSIVIPWAELAHNKTKAGVIKLMSRKMDVAKNSLKDKIATTLLGTGAGDAIEGLDLMTDSGALSSSYGTLARSTYGSVINGQVTAASGGVISLVTLGAQMDLCSPAGSDSESTDIMMTTKTVWGYVEQILDTKERYNFQNIPSYVTPYTQSGGTVTAAEKGAASGFRAIFHRGVPLIKDEKIASGKIYTLCEKYIDFARLEFPNMKQIKLSNEVTKGVYEKEPTPSAFQITEMMNPYNQLGDIGHIIVYGNLINRNPRRSGVITGVTGI